MEDSMLLDIQAAQAVARSKLFERAVNDPGPWAIRIGDHTEWVIKVRTNLGVRFIAHFEPGVEGDVAWLVCQGQEVSAQDVEPDPVGFALEWRIGVSREVPVNA
jgi:hypothetical protein